jgi:hypothetical protein
VAVRWRRLRSRVAARAFPAKLSKQGCPDLPVRLASGSSLLRAGVPVSAQ